MMQDPRDKAPLPLDPSQDDTDEFTDGFLPTEQERIGLEKLALAATTVDKNLSYNFDSNLIKLSIELVPQSCWYINLRSELSITQWKKLRQECYKQADHCCEICGEQGAKSPVECHERWHYDEKNKVQRLEGLIALCPDCHEVKHIGLAIMKNRKDIAIRQLTKVNNWNIEQANAYVTHAFSIWRQRSQEKWTLDIQSWLQQRNISVKKKKVKKQPSEFILAIKNLDKEKIQAFLKDKQAVAKDKEHLLEEAIETGDINIVKLFLEKPELKKQINNCPVSRLPPVHLAIRKKNLAILQTLLQEGANIELLDSGKKTVFHHAAQAAVSDIIKFLLERCPKKLIAHRDRQSRTLLHYLGFPISKKAMSRPHSATQDLPKIKEAFKLFQPFISPEILNIKDRYQKTILHQVAGFADEELLTAILAITGDAIINEVDRYNKTALHEAAIYSNLSALTFLLEKKANPYIRSDQTRGASGLTAFEEIAPHLSYEYAKAFFAPYMTEFPSEEEIAVQGSRNKSTVLGKRNRNDANLDAGEISQPPAKKPVPDTSQASQLPPEHEYPESPDLALPLENESNDNTNAADAAAITLNNPQALNENTVEESTIHSKPPNHSVVSLFQFFSNRLTPSSSSTETPSTDTTSEIIIDLTSDDEENNSQIIDLT